jgi:hypothetical protein
MLQLIKLVMSIKKDNYLRYLEVEKFLNEKTYRKSGPCLKFHEKI